RRVAARSEQHEAVAMDDLFGGVGKVLAEEGSVAPEETGDIRPGILGDALSDALIGAFVDDPDRIARPEVSLGCRHADRQEARPTLAEPPGRAIVDLEGSGRALRVFEPELVRRETTMDGSREQRAHLFAGRGSRELTVARAVADHHGDAGLTGDPG